MESQYYINVTDGNERGFAYELNEKCHTCGLDANEEEGEFILYDYFYDSPIVTKRKNYCEISKADYEMLIRLSFLQTEGIIRNETLQAITEDIIQAVLDNKEELKMALF